ncbi:hypothetical protein Tco_0412240, partial [Tanacetum coccineum]
MAMTADENSESESDTEELPFDKITINTDYKIKTSLEEPPTDLELKPLPDNLECVFLEEPSFLHVIILIVHDRYVICNRSGYAVLISLNEYVVLDRKLDTPYPMEVDTPYSAIDQNN